MSNQTNNFKTYHRQATGVEYSSRLMSLTQEQFKALPPITFVLDDGVEVCSFFCHFVLCTFFILSYGRAD